MREIDWNTYFDTHSLSEIYQSLQDAKHRKSLDDFFQKNALKEWMPEHPLGAIRLLTIVPETDPQAQIGILFAKQVVHAKEQSKDIIREVFAVLGSDITITAELAQKFCEIAKQALRDEEFKFAYKIFSGLIGKGHGYEKGIKAAGEAVQSENLEVREHGLKLYKELFEKEQGYEKAIKAAGDAVQNENTGVHQSGLHLYNMLVEKGQGYEKAIKAAGEAVQSEDETVRRVGLQLYEKLVEKGLGYEQAIEAAGEAMQSEDRWVRKYGLLLCEKLVSDKQYDAVTHSIVKNSIPDTGKSFAQDYINYVKKFREVDLRALLIEKGRQFFASEENIELYKQELDKKWASPLYVVAHSLIPGKGSEIVQKRYFKDTRNQKPIIQALLAMDAKAFARAATTTPEEFSHDVKVIHALITLNKKEAVYDTSTPLDVSLEKCIRDHVDLPWIDNFTKRYMQTFGKSQNPLAIFIFTANMANLNNNEIMQSLAEYVGAVLQGDEVFRSMRNDTTQNAHLKKLDEYDSALLTKWQAVALKKLTITTGGKAAFDFREWTKVKLITDKHLQSVEIPELFAYLQTGDKEAVFNLRTQMKEYTGDRKKDKAFAILQLQERLIRLISAKATEYSSLLSTIEDLVIKLDEKAPFLHDVEDRKKALQAEAGSKQREETVTLMDTDDPIDLLEMGKEVEGSCQSYDGDPELCQGLIGTIWDGQDRIFVVKDSSGRIRARFIGRLEWDGEKPVLFRERFYGEERYRKILEEFMQERANDLGVPYLTLDGKGEPYDKDIVSLGGKGPVKYLDSAEGNNWGGKHTIRGAKYVKASIETFQG